MFGKRIPTAGGYLTLQEIYSLEVANYAFVYNWVIEISDTFASKNGFIIINSYTIQITF